MPLKKHKSITINGGNQKQMMLLITIDPSQFSTNIFFRSFHNYKHYFKDFLTFFFGFLNI